jgi:hypothetical protein
MQGTDQDFLQGLLNSTCDRGLLEGNGNGDRQLLNTSPTPLGKCFSFQAVARANQKCLTTNKGTTVKQRVNILRFKAVGYTIFIHSGACIFN